MKMLKCTDRKVALLIRATAGQLSHAGRMTALLLVSVLAITSADAQNYEYNREALSTDNVVINADSDNDGPTDAIYFKIGSISNNAWMNSPQMVINRYRATSFVPLLVSRRGTGFYYGIGTELYQPDIAVNNGLAFQIGKSDTDKNTGKLRFVYKGDHSADNLLTLGFHTRDDILNVAASGKVGISTAEPFAKVDILGGGTSTDTGGEPMMAFQYNTGGYRHHIKTRHDGTGDGTSVTNTNAIDFYLNSGNSAGASSAPGTGNVHGMSVTAAGVGIGTTLPSSPLHISKSGTGTNYGIGTELYQPDIALNNGLAFQIGKSSTDKNTGKLRFVYKGDHSTDNLLTLGFHTKDDILNVAASGKVGISTADPFAKVDILGGSANTGAGGEPMMAFQYNTGGYRHYIKTRHDGTGDATSVTNKNAIDFYLNSSNSAGASSAPGTGNVHGMSVTAAGVGIGTTVPTSKLDVDGAIRIRGGSPGAGKVLMSDELGNAVWETSSGSVGWAVSGTAPNLVTSTASKVGMSTAEPFAKVDILGGSANTGAGGEPMMAFQYNTGGYRHYINTRNDGTGDATSVNK